MKGGQAEPSVSLVAPFASIGSLIVLAILAVLGIVTLILIAVHPAFRMMFYIVVSAAATYYLAQVIKLRKPLYFMGTFFALVILFLASPVFMSMFPPTAFATTGEAALAQATAGEGATQSQMILCVMPLIAAGTIAGIMASRAKTTIQLILLSLSAVLVSIFAVWALLLV